MEIEANYFPVRSCEQIYTASQRRLENMASITMRDELHPSDYFIFAIDTADPTWENLIKVLYPGDSWKDWCENGIIQGTVQRDGFEEYLIEMAPELATPLREPSTFGVIKALVFGEGSIAVMPLNPVRHFQD